MANNKVKHYRTNVVGRKPDPAKLEEGEIAINMADKHIFTKVGTKIVNIGNGADATVEGGQVFKGDVKANKLSTDTDIVSKNAVSSKISFVDEHDKEKVSIVSDAQTDGAGNLKIIVQDGKATDKSSTFVINGNGTLNLPAAPVKGENATRKDYVDVQIKKTADKSASDLKTNVDTLNNKIDANDTKQTDALTAIDTTINAKIDANDLKLSNALTASDTTLNKKIDANDAKQTKALTNSDAALNKRIDEVDNGQTGAVNTKVSKAGDTMTGDLRLTTPGDTRFRLKDVELRSNGSNQLIISTPTQAIHIRPKGNDSTDQQAVFGIDGTLTLDRVITRSVQSGDVASLTRKDYVDVEVKKSVDLANSAKTDAANVLGTAKAAESKATNAETIANSSVKKAGDTMTGLLNAGQGVSVTNIGGSWASNGVFPGPGDGATWEKVNFDITSWYGIGIKSSQGDAPRTIVINARNGDITSQGVFTTSKNVIADALSINNIVRRSDNGALLANDGNINLKFASGTHASGFVNGYLLEQIGNRLNTKLTKAIQLDKRNLNDVMDVGLYEQHANANTPNLNYPENLAGSLTVTMGAGVQQTYHIYNSSRVWRRAKYDVSPWTPWRQAFNYGDGSLAVGFLGTSSLGNASIALGDNDTGIKQDGDGNFEIWANAQRVARMTSSLAAFDRQVSAPVFSTPAHVAVGAAMYQNDGNIIGGSRWNAGAGNLYNHIEARAAAHAQNGINRANEVNNRINAECITAFRLGGIQQGWGGNGAHDVTAGWVVTGMDKGKSGSTGNGTIQLRCKCLQVHIPNRGWVNAVDLWGQA